MDAGKKIPLPNPYPITKKHGTLSMLGYVPAVIDTNPNVYIITMRVVSSVGRASDF